VIPSPELIVVMSVLRVTCGSCGRGWYIAGNVSVYFQLDLLSHPCPYCEAYALSCADVSSRRPARCRAALPGGDVTEQPDRPVAADGLG
jgi:hypothetical protein